MRSFYNVTAWWLFLSLPLQKNQSKTSVKRMAGSLSRWLIRWLACDFMVTCIIIWVIQLTMYWLLLIWQTNTHTQQKFGIKTAGLDEKCTAMQMLVVYAKDLQEGFANYAESVATIMIPHLKFFFHELVRAAAAEILPYLLECVKSNGTIAIVNIPSFFRIAFFFSSLFDWFHL